MKDKGREKRVRLAREERCEAERLARLEDTLRKWKRGTIFVGIASKSALYRRSLCQQSTPFIERIRRTQVPRIPLDVPALRVHAAATTYNVWPNVRPLRNITKPATAVRQ